MDVSDIIEAAEALIELGVAEDIGPGDATSIGVLSERTFLEAHIVAKQEGVLAGMPVMEAVFQRIDSAISFQALRRDGERVQPGDTVAEVKGPGRSMLTSERLALNFLQHLSGIATLTNRFVKALSDTDTVILDTRKTLPGYRILEKYAVRMGGGENHRMSLYDMLLIKDNHIEAAGSITTAIEQAKIAYPDLPLEVEVKSLEELQEVLDADVDRVMLDNMSLDEMREAVHLTDRRFALEASGNVTLNRVADIAATGVDYISSGALTHSAPVLDISMDVTCVRQSSGLAAGETGERRDSTIEDRIRTAKRELGDSLVILGHHYQRDEVIQFADYRGDSLKLAREAASRPEARYIVFCGVHFMAETAAVLAQPDQVVLLPELEAGCPLAEMASREDVEHAWATLAEVTGGEQTVLPVTYVNSAASLKAFCVDHGGLVCTSSNAGAALDWALDRRPKVLFFPDQHLGRNTARAKGIGLDEMIVWEPSKPFGGHTLEAIQEARIILWRGFCNVHQRFLPEHVQTWRERIRDIQIIVHPECRMDVVDLADDAGSTAHIIRQVAGAPPGTKWAIGTEANLVSRLRQEHPEQFIVSLASQPSYCRTMNMITPEKLARILDALRQGEHINRITVPDAIATSARTALERMLELTE